MEEDEECIWQAHATATPSCRSVGRQTLNEDPSNVLAEQLAMEYCMQSFDVVQEMSETEMVITSCGTMAPGTPDGGFIDSNGLLRLVQVVRVPLLPDMDAGEVADALYDTVLTKVVKSQAWMKQTGILPHDFTIFCWLPPVGPYEVCLEQSDELLWTEALISNVQSGGWPFSLQVKVPDDPGGMFPMFFGQVNRVKKVHQVCYSLNPSDFETDGEDEAMEWYLFDHSETEEPVADDVVEDEVPSNLHALLVVAIQTIEYAEQVCQGVRVTPGLLGYLPKASECDVFTRQSPHFWKPLSSHADGAEPGRISDREKAYRSSRHLFTPSMKARTGFWDGPFVVNISKEVGVPMLVPSAHAQGLDGSNRSSEEMSVMMDVPIWIAFMHMLAYHCIGCENHAPTLHVVGGLHLQDCATPLKTWWTKLAATIKALTSRWIAQFADFLLQIRKSNKCFMPLQLYWCRLQKLSHKLNAMFLLISCTV